MDQHSSELHEVRNLRIKQGKPVIDLSMINPDIPPETVLIDWLHEFSIKEKNHKYSVSRGIRKLREAFAVKYKKKFSIDLNPETEVCVSSGTKDALFHILTCLASPGDVVLVGSPTYPIYETAAKLSRLHTAYFKIDKDENQMLANIEKALEVTRAKVLVLNFPNNPTGITVTKDFYSRVSEVAQRWGTFIVNDFVYGEMGFKEQPISILHLKNTYEKVLEIYSMSKAYGIPGWRVGAVFGDSEVIGEISRLKSLSDYGLFLPFQLAASHALITGRDLVGPLVRKYNRRMDAIINGLKESGWSCSLPSAGAALWLELPEFIKVDNSGQFALELLNKYGVMVSVGSQFGDSYERFIRMALVADDEKLMEVVDSFSELSKRWLS